jgi:hypothetical protein
MQGRVLLEHFVLQRYTATSAMLTADSLQNTDMQPNLEHAVVLLQYLHNTEQLKRIEARACMRTTTGLDLE